MATVSWDDLGPIRSLAADCEQAWTGEVSLGRRIDAGELEHSDVKRALGELPDYFRPTTRGQRARVRCIDGRPIEGYDDPDLRDKLFHRPLGPQVPGGTPTAALIDRIVRGGGVGDNVDLQHDVAFIARELQKLDYRPGGHIDDGVHPGTTGCGAIDQMPAILARIAQPVAQDHVRAFARLLLNEEYDDDTASLIIGRMILLESKADRYLDRRPSGEYGFRAEAMHEIRRANAHGIVRLVGGHEEIACCINFVHSTTFHRDEFCFRHGRHIQAFNFDFWRSEDLANKLYDDDSDGVLALRRQYLTARALFMAATLMVLTDGTLHLFVRR